MLAMLISVFPASSIVIFFTNGFPRPSLSGLLFSPPSRVYYLTDGLPLPWTLLAEGGVFRTPIQPNL